MISYLLKQGQKLWCIDENILVLKELQASLDWVSCIVAEVNPQRKDACRGLESSINLGGWGQVLGCDLDNRIHWDKEQNNIQCIAMASLRLDSVLRQYRWDASFWDVRSATAIERMDDVCFFGESRAEAAWKGVLIAMKEKKLHFLSAATGSLLATNRNCWDNDILQNSRLGSFISIPSHKRRAKCTVKQVWPIEQWWRKKSWRRGANTTVLSSHYAPLNSYRKCLSMSISGWCNYSFPSPFFKHRLWPGRWAASPNLNRSSVILWPGFWWDIFLQTLFHWGLNKDWCSICPSLHLQQLL